MERDGARRTLEEAVDERVASEHPRRYADGDRPTDDPHELRREQTREVDEIVAGPGVSAFTGPMWRGLLLGGVLGAAIGFALAVPVALVPFGGFPWWGRLLIVGVSFMAAGATAGAHYWGGRLPELSGESVDADNTPSAGSTLADPRTDDRGRPSR